MATSDTEGSLVNMPEYMRTITAVGTLLTAILAADVAMTKAAFAHEEHGRFSAGEPGEATKPTRIIEVKMFEGGGKNSPNDFEEAFRRARGADAILQLDDAMFTSERVRLVELAAAHRLPVVYGPRDFAELGGLLALGPNYSDLYRRAATYVDKILKGAKPGDLPIEQPPTFALVINLKTARALGLSIPPAVLARADEVIE
jgi:ABC transporter substrate binding protein